MVESAPYELEDYSLDDKDMQIRAIAGDAAIVAYNVRERLVVEPAQDSRGV